MMTITGGFWLGSTTRSNRAKKLKTEASNTQPITLRSLLAATAPVVMTKISQKKKTVSIKAMPRIVGETILTLKRSNCQWESHSEILHEVRKHYKRIWPA